MELFRLFGSIMIEDRAAIESLKKVDNKGKDTGNSLEKIAEKGAKIGAAIVTGLGGAYAGLMAFAKGTADTADKWDKLALRTGIGVENLQEWGYAAEQSGADIGKLEVGMKKLSDMMVGAINGSKSSKEAFQHLGISMEELASMTPEQTFERVMYALGNMEDGALKNAVGNDLLGKSYTELLPLIKQGSGGMNELKNRARELGIVMSKENVDAGVVFGDTMADLTASFNASKDALLAELMPTFTSFANWVISQMPAIKSVMGGTFNFIVSTIGFLVEHSNILIPVLAAVAGGFVALKVIGVINSLMTTYQTILGVVTAAQALLNGTMAANPIGLVVTAIGALIGIGTALIMNFESVSQTVSAVWNTILNTISGAINTAKDVVGNAINAIKNFLNFNWSWPKIPLPHFSISGSMNPLDWLSQGLPKIGVEWYAKGGIMQSPTVFGMNGNNLMVGGEVPGVKEAVLPLNAKTLAGIGEGIFNNSETANNTSYFARMISLLEQLLEKDTNVYLDKKKVSEGIWSPVQKNMDKDATMRRLLKGER